MTKNRKSTSSVRAAKAKKGHVRKKVQRKFARPVKKVRASDAGAARKAARKAQDKAREKFKAAEALAAEKNKVARIRTNEILERATFAEFISQNVGKRAVDVLKLIHSPQTDESVAAELSMKINEVRRILNVLNGYGVARYDTNKDNKGWLTFKWHVDVEKLVALNTTVDEKKPENAYRVASDCNDFFCCTKCYKEQKVILPFDAAFENQFRCDVCGSKLRQLSKEEVVAVFLKDSANVV